MTPILNTAKKYLLCSTRITYINTGNIDLETFLDKRPNILLKVKEGRSTRLIFKPPD